jgi:hypothetical protein
VFNFRNFRKIRSNTVSQSESMWHLTSTFWHDLVVWCLLQHCIKGYNGTFLGNCREYNESCFDVCGSKHWKFAEYYFPFQKMVFCLVSTPWKPQIPHCKMFKNLGKTGYLLPRNILKYVNIFCSVQRVNNKICLVCYTELLIIKYGLI